MVISLLLFFYVSSAVSQVIDTLYAASVVTADDPTIIVNEQSAALEIRNDQEPLEDEQVDQNQENLETNNDQLAIETRIDQQQEVQGIRNIRRPKLTHWSCVPHPFLYCGNLVENKFDSGIAVFAIAYLTAADCPITFKLDELEDFRRQLAHWILNGDLPF